jgi:hypothetical protein
MTDLTSWVVPIYWNPIIAREQFECECECECKLKLQASGSANYFHRLSE